VLWKLRRHEARLAKDTAMSTHAIHVRKPELDFDSEIERFYFGGDPVKTYIFNALNLLFPAGERYFVRSVHRYQSAIRDPELARDMREFAAQEGQHAHQHERFFAVLARQGYDVERFLRFFANTCRDSQRRLPPGLQLAITAGSEHYTALMAAAVLHSGLLDDCHPTLRSLIVWHAVEEIEHKHVAYDVLTTAHPNNYPLRIAGFVLSTLSISGHAFYAYHLLKRQDLAAGRVTRAQLSRGVRGLLQGREREFLRLVFSAMVRYFKPGFHPNQHDDSALLERYAPEIPLAGAA
jgi:predicted metal-dependent hydrolase